MLDHVHAASATDNTAVLLPMLLLYQESSTFRGELSPNDQHAADARSQAVTASCSLPAHLSP